MQAIKIYAAFAITLLLLVAAFYWRPMQAPLANPAQKAATPLAVVQANPAVPTVVTPVINSAAKTPGAHFLDDLVQQKYAILFSVLQLSVQAREQLQYFLREREAIAGRGFYSAGDNPAEIAENLRQRELELSAMDERIAAVLTSEDAKKYALLKDSTYEQALLEGFYQLAQMDDVPEQQKVDLLLNKLVQKQSLTGIVAGANEQIANAAPDTKLFLIEQVHKAFMVVQEDYLRTVKTGLSDEQFELLRQYEQVQLDERWQDLLSSWQ